MTTAINNSVKLAAFWVALHALKEQLDNELLPLMGYLGIDDANLLTAFEKLSVEIEQHFERFRLVAEYKK